MSDVAKIAAGLTKAQRKSLFNLKGRYTDRAVLKRLGLVAGVDPAVMVITPPRPRRPPIFAGARLMRDNEKLVERLRDLGIHSADLAATTIEAKAREIAELRECFDSLDTIHETLDECYAKVEAERDTLRAQLTETQARLAEVKALNAALTNFIKDQRSRAYAFLSKQEGA